MQENNTNSFFDRLRKGIMPLHDQAERHGPLNAIVAKSITMPQYRSLLERFHGFVGPAEELIEPIVAHYSIGLDYNSLKRLPHLEKDLYFLGITRDEIRRLPRCNDLNHFDTVPKAIGILYLFEGSRLGGMVLAKALKEQLDLSELQGYAYFASNGADAPSLWRSFKEEVGRYVSSTGHEEEIIESAQKGFAALNAWLLRR